MSKDENPVMTFPQSRKESSLNYFLSGRQHLKFKMVRVKMRAREKGVKSLTLKNNNKWE